MVDCAGLENQCPFTGTQGSNPCLSAFISKSPLDEISDFFDESYVEHHTIGVGGVRVGVSLVDRETDDIVFDVNFWHYRAIVEAVRSLRVLPDARIDALHELWQDNGLSVEEARVVAGAIRSRLLPALADDERLLLDGRRTTQPDDGTMHYGPAEQHKNYSTNRRVLEEFATCCETCNGFSVC